jgi:electron transfer flavoprotein beta subunit
MKILVPLKRVPDPDTKIRVNASGSGLETDGVKYAINPFDAIALEEALRLRDQVGTAEILVVSIGSADCQEQLRAGLAMGADRAMLVRHDAEVDSLAVAKLLAAIYRREQPNLVLMGKQAIDNDANQAGQMLAALLGIGQATFISKLAVSADAAKAICCRETDAGLESVSVALPAVITADLRLNEPRYVTALGIMKAKKKPLEEITPADLGVDPASRTRLLKLSLAPKRKAGIRVKTVDELLKKLREEAQVI